MWPGGRRASWSGDRVAELARYLLTRNGDGDRYASVVARHLDSFDGVPAPTVAEVKLLAGEVGEAERSRQLPTTRDRSHGRHTC